MISFHFLYEENIFTTENTSEITLYNVLILKMRKLGPLRLNVLLKLT